MTYLSRRQFLKASALAAVTSGFTSPMWAEEIKKMRISVQLYSVRDDCKKDFDAALAQIAAMGFTGVEFAGYFNYADKASELRKRLDGLNLKAAGTHIGTGCLCGDAFEKTIEFHKTLGCKFLLVPGDKDFIDPEKSKALAETFNKAAEKLKFLDMACGYHNHTHEFAKDGDKTYWDLFAERTSKDVVLQLDCGWAWTAKQNPAELIRRHPGRTRITHFKPAATPDKLPILGQDSVDWLDVTKACRDFGGTEWTTIEQERYLPGISPMDCTKMSLAGLKKIYSDLKS